MKRLCEKTNLLAHCIAQQHIILIAKQYNLSRMHVNELTVLALEPRLPMYWAI